MLLGTYLKDENICNCVIGQDRYNRRSFSWPIPPGETHRIPSIYLSDVKMTKRDKLVALTSKVKKEIEEFVDFTLSRLHISKKDVLSNSHMKEFVNARALLAYAIRTRWRLNSRDASYFIKRDYTSMNSIQMIAVREYGPSMQAVSDILKAWDNRGEIKNQTKEIVPAKKEYGYYGASKKINIKRNES